MDIKHKNKIVGRLEGYTYYSLRKPEHFMVMFQGFGISQKVLDALLKFNCEVISIQYVGKKGTIIYECSINKFLESNKTFTFEDDDLQKFVSVGDMTKI